MILSWKLHDPVKCLMYQLLNFSEEKNKKMLDVRKYQQSAIFFLNVMIPKHLSNPE